MDLLEQLKIYVNSFCDSAPINDTYWRHVATHINSLCAFCNENYNISREQLELHINEIQKYVSENSQRCTGGNYLTGAIYYAPRKEVIQTQDKRDKIKSLINELINLSEDEYDKLLSNKSDNSDISINNLSNITPCIFIGHGRSAIYKQVIDYLKDELKIDENKILYFESEDRTSQHIVDVFKGFLDITSLAILVMTAEDETLSDKIRARQNVIHEIGLFQGTLGFDKVIILKQEGIEEFSNIAGLQYIPFTGSIEYTSLKMLKEKLRREGLIQ